MRTHTTYTDLRYIMKLHGEGQGAKDISEHLSIALSEVEHCISARTGKTKARTRKKKVTEPVQETQESPTPETTE